MRGGNEQGDDAAEARPNDPAGSERRADAGERRVEAGEARAEGGEGRAEGDERRAQGGEGRADAGQTPPRDPAAAVTARNVAYFENPAAVAAFSREEGLRPLEAELVARFFPPAPAGVLDLGCGGGRTTIGLAGLGYRVLGIDLSQALIGEARRRFPALDFRPMDATRLELPAASFDAALFSYNGIDGIYPLAARRRALAEAYRVLRPGGVFLFSSHNALGALWSGGYFYWRGYRNVARMLAAQRRNALAFQGYLLYRDAAAGDQLLYSAPPGRTERQLRETGFELLGIFGYNMAMSPHAVRRHAQHVHFASRKPPGAGTTGA